MLAALGGGMQPDEYVTQLLGKWTEGDKAALDELIQQVATWEKSWGGTVGRLEMQNGAGKTWTRQEKEAGANATRSLTQDEPAPQTLYYKPEATSGQPVMVNVSLRYGRAVPTARIRRRS